MHTVRSIAARGLWALLALLILKSKAGADEVLTLGVFAYRPKPVMEKRYQPLADSLGATLGDQRVVLRVFDQDEMERALAKKELDMVFTNPSHYIVLRNRNTLTGDLATLVSMESGQATSHLGGVIIAHADRLLHGGLEQLRGQIILKTSVDRLISFEKARGCWR